MSAQTASAVALEMFKKKSVANSQTKSIVRNTASSGIRKVQNDREQWQAGYWGTLPVVITDDPNFRPTNPLPVLKKPLKCKKSLKHSKMSLEDYNAERKRKAAKNSSTQTLAQKVGALTQDDFELLL